MIRDEIVSLLRKEYRDVRVLPDGSIACLGDLMYTRAIHLGCDEFSWERRFCFDDRNLALEEFYRLQSKDDIPTGYIARR